MTQLTMQCPVGRVCSPESPPSEKQSGKETKRTGIGSRVSEIQSDADPLVDFFFFSLFLDRDRRSHPTKIPLHKLSLWAPFVKKAGGWRKSA